MAPHKSKELSTLLRKLRRETGSLDTLNSLAVWYLSYQANGQTPLSDVRYLSTEDVRFARELSELENGSKERIIKASNYFENKAYEYFAEAYHLKRTVKSTQNFAWFLFHERGEEERGLKIQRECLALEPRSVHPYYQCCRMLLCQERYGEAIPYFTAAYNREQDGATLQNIGACTPNLATFNRPQSVSPPSSRQTVISMTRTPSTSR